MRILIITNLFPNNKEPRKAQYHQQQFRELSKLCELKIVAPLPSLKYSFKEVPQKETIDGLDVYHPRYLVTPKVFRSLYWLFFFFGVLKDVKKIYKSFKFDLILTLWAYPDGVGSFLIAKCLNKPIVIAGLGSDINLYTKYFLRRKMIAHTLKNSSKVMAVSDALKDKMVEIGVPKEKIKVIPNGVDTDLFKPMKKEDCRKRLSLPLEKKIVLYVGNLEAVKGIDILVAAMEKLPEHTYLVIVGEGKLKDSLKFKVKGLRLENRVTFLGARPHSEIPLWMNGCDMFCLPSRNEGCPNVVLEALACGKPVVATRVGGTPEIITSEDYGILVLSQNSHALAQGIQKALKKNWDLMLLREKGAEKTWQKNAKRIFDELQTAVDKNEE